MGASGGAAGAARQRHVTLAPSRRLYGLAAIMFAPLAACTRNRIDFGAPAFLVPLAVASVTYPPRHPGAILQNIPDKCANAHNSLPFTVGAL